MEEWKETYRWWWEFLKRSEDYRILCDWSVSVLKDEKNRLAFDVIDTGNGKLIIDDYPIYIRWWIDRMIEKGTAPDKDIPFPFPRYRLNEKDKTHSLLYKYFPFFGNVHIGSFDGFWKKFSQQTEKYFGKNNILTKNNLVVEGWNGIVPLCNYVEKIMFHRENNQNIDIDEFKKQISNFMKIESEASLYIKIETQCGTLKEILKRVETLIKKYRGTTQGKSIMSSYKKYKIPTRMYKNEPFSRYLSVFDFWGKTDIKTIVETIYPGTSRDTTENFDSLVSMTTRDYEYAKRIIANVEQGKFPGNYKSAK